MFFRLFSLYYLSPQTHKPVLWCSVGYTHVQEYSLANEPFPPALCSFDFSLVSIQSVNSYLEQ